MLQEASMSRLQQETGAINTISQLIKELAEQCNLLSINASIEAARAGEYGKGFSVVTGEFTKLAGQTKSSAIKISGITDALISSIETAYQQMEKGRKLSSESSKYVGIANEVYHHIFKAAADMKQNASLIGNQAIKANEQTQHVLREIELLGKE